MLYNVITSKREKEHTKLKKRMYRKISAELCIPT